MTLWWTTKALPWLKKNWQWVLLPVGVLIALSKLFKPKLESVSAESLGAAQVKQDADAKAIAAVAEATEVRGEKVEKLTKETEEAIDAQVDEITVKTEVLRKDSKAANEHLLDVGRKIRKP
jgi:hypothetical protein